MIGKRFRSLPFIFANDNYTLRSRKSREKSGRGYLRRRSRQEEGDPKEAQAKAEMKRACGKEEPHGRLEQKAMERRRKQKKCKDRLQEVGKDGEKSKLCGRRGG